MSSFIGHSIPAIGLFFSKRRHNISFVWLIWLILVAWFPDIDYLSATLRPQGLRITHSIVGCLIVPCLTIAVLAIFKIRGEQLKFIGLQLFLTSYSHLVLDLSVGVGALPLLYPWSPEKFKLPFGLLPSAGKINLSNYYFYRNLLIEMGALLPLFLCLYLLTQQSAMTKNRKILIIVLALFSACFMYWGFSLPR